MLNDIHYVNKFFLNYFEVIYKTISVTTKINAMIYLCRIIDYYK